MLVYSSCLMSIPMFYALQLNDYTNCIYLLILTLVSILNYTLKDERISRIDRHYARYIAISYTASSLIKSDQNILYLIGGINGMIAILCYLINRLTYRIKKFQITTHIFGTIGLLFYLTAIQYQPLDYIFVS